MSRVLIGWELGSGPDYGRVIRGLAGALAADGHEVTVALQRPDVWTPLAGVRAFQAPVWPGLLVNMIQAEGRASTMGDVLARLGLGRAGALGGLIAAWDAILAVARPDLVVACFAPALLNAARGRARTVTIGTGFAQPPGDGAALTRFAGEPGFDEAALLDTVDAELRAAGREPLAALPALFAADEALVASFAELDPYAGARATPHCRPEFDPAAQADGAGGEVFVYANARAMPAGLWEALRQTGLPVRAHVADADEDVIAALRGLGVIIERRPVPWTRIAARSRLIVSHGGHGTACASLAAGVPHVVVPHDLEKFAIGRAVEELGAGRSVAAADIAEAVRAAYADEELAERARALAPDFVGRAGETLEARLRELARA